MAPRTDNSRSKKVQHVADRLSSSKAFMKCVALSAAEWAGILSELDEEKIDGFTLLLDEEKSGLEDIEKERKRKHTSNKARYLQRLEKLRITAEQPDSNPSE